MISTQVLQEYAHVALNKLHQRQDVILRQLVLLEDGLTVVQQTPALIRRSVEIKATYQISFWDACIVSAAEFEKCHSILSEDMNNGQFYSGIAMRNPF